MLDESTTPHLVEGIRSSLRALSRRDYDGAVAPFSVDAVMDVSAADGEVLEGREAIQEFMEAWRGPYDEFELVLEEFRDLSSGVTFATLLQRGRLPGGGAFLYVRGGHIGVWRDGLIERNTVYPEAELDQARAAAERLAEERGWAIPDESTTPDPIEIGRKMIEADSYETWAALAERFYAPDVVMDLGGMIGSMEGLAAVLAFVGEYWLMWEEHHHYVEDIVDLGHGVGYAVVREDGRMKGSSEQVQARNAWVSVWVEDRIVRTVMFTDIDEGRAAAERLAKERG